MPSSAKTTVVFSLIAFRAFVFLAPFAVFFHEPLRPRGAITTPLEAELSCLCTPAAALCGRLRCELFGKFCFFFFFFCKILHRQRVPLQNPRHPLLH